jgi:predicted RNA-binding Zn-ribbon protein involved in translation (DUF1610 family)
MILFKACPRCGGDIDTTYGDDVHCIQYAHRPAVVCPGPRLAEPQRDRAEKWTDTPAGWRGSKEAVARPPTSARAEWTICPKCGSAGTMELDKLRFQDNTCYRCRSCDHIFSPYAEGSEPQPGAAVP